MMRCDSKDADARREGGCDAVSAASVREQPRAARFDIERSRCAPARRSRFAATSPGRPTATAPLGEPSNAADALLGRNPSMNMNKSYNWDGAIFTHSGVTRHSFGITKLYDSRVGLRENRAPSHMRGILR